MGSLRNYLRAWNRLHKASQLKMGIFFRPGLQKGVENDIFWSEIGSGFKEPGCTPSPGIPRSIPPPPGLGELRVSSFSVKLKGKSPWHYRLQTNIKTVFSMHHSSQNNIKFLL